MLTNYLSIRLINEKAIKEIKDCKYLTFIQSLLDVLFNLFYINQTGRFLQSNDIVKLIVFTNSDLLLRNNSNLLLKIDYATYLTKIINKTKYKKITNNVLVIKLYMMAHRFNIEKQY